MTESEHKGRLYKTAQFTQAAVSSPHSLGKLTRDPVRVVFHIRTWNAVFQRDENVFACYRTMDDTTLIGMYFEAALENFCL